MNRLRVLSALVAAASLSACAAKTLDCDEKTVLLTLSCGPARFSSGELEVKRTGDGRTFSKSVMFACPGEDFVFRLNVADYKAGDEYQVRFTPADASVKPTTATLRSPEGCLPWKVQLTDEALVPLPSPPDAGASEAGLAAGKLLGENCGSTSECEAGRVCADGVCCATACQGVCEACNLPESLGTCTSVPEGKLPTLPKACEAKDLASCKFDGTCNGSGMCRENPAAPSCEGGTCEGEAGCKDGLACVDKRCTTVACPQGLTKPQDILEQSPACEVAVEEVILPNYGLTGNRVYLNDAGFLVSSVKCQGSCAKFWEVMMQERGQAPMGHPNPLASFAKGLSETGFVGILLDDSNGTGIYKMAFWDGEKMTTFERRMFTEGVNDFGFMVGHNNGIDAYDKVRLCDPTCRYIGDFGGAQVATGIASDAETTIVGVGGAADLGVQVAFVYRKSMGIKNLNDLLANTAKTTFPVAADVSNDGRFIAATGPAGAALIDTRPPPPWTYTQLDKLDGKRLFSEAVNERGDVVGYLEGTEEPFIYTAATGAVKLSNQLKGVPAGLALGRVTDINNQRELATFGTRGGVVRALRISLPGVCWAQMARCGRGG